MVGNMSQPGVMFSRNLCIFALDVKAHAELAITLTPPPGSKDGGS